MPADPCCPPVISTSSQLALGNLPHTPSPISAAAPGPWPPKPSTPGLQHPRNETNVWEDVCCWARGLKVPQQALTCTSPTPGPYGERDDQQVFVQKVVPSASQLFVRLSSTGQR